MKKVTLLDDAAGNALGWNPDGVTTIFKITEPNIDFDTSYVSATIAGPTGIPVGLNCEATPVLGESAFNVRCGIDLAAAA